MIKNKRLIILIAFLMIILSFLTYYFINKDTSGEDSLLNKTFFSEDETLVYLGDSTLDNEILFVFDYSCSWCTRWIDEIFPIIYKRVEAGEVKFRTQSMVFLNDASLQLSRLDQNIKNHYPDKYFDILLQIIADGQDDNYEQMLANQYIDGLISAYQLDKNILLAEPTLDAIQLTRQYTKGLDIDSVPTIIVNGVKVEDSFSLDEIENLLK